MLAGFYFSCGPLVVLGFWIGHLQGFELAIVSDAIFWILIALLKEIPTS